MKTTQMAGVLGVCALAGFVTLPGSALAVSDSPVANLTEKWSADPSGWIKEGAGSGIWNAGSLAVSYPQRDTWTSVDITGLYANNAASGGRFIGNYIQKKISEITFEVKRSAFTGQVYFYITANRHLWQREIAMPAGDGVWGSVVIPLAYDANWKVSPASVVKTADLMTDLASVTEVGVIAYRNGSQLQGVSVDNFRAVGPWGQIIAAGEQQGLSASWLAENPLPAGRDKATDDADGDGFSNLAEFTAGTDANSGSSFFAIDIGRNASGKPVLKWTPKAYRTYTVMQSADLVNGQSFTSKFAGLQTLGDNNEVEVEEAGPGPFFYKATVVQEVTQ